MSEIDIEFELTDSSDMTSDPYSDSTYEEESDFSLDEEEEEESDFVSFSQEMKENEEMFLREQEKEKELLEHEDDRKRKYGIDPEGKYFLNPFDPSSIAHFEELHNKN